MSAAELNTDGWPSPVLTVAESLQIALIRQAVVALRDQGVAILLVEQRVQAVLEVADRVLFVENGRAVHEATPAALRSDESLIHRYVGV